MNNILYSNILGKHNKINILIFHGLFGNGSNWISIANKMSKYYKIHLLDIRNHGLSFYSNNMNYDLMAIDIINYIKYYKIYKPILIGHSIGGKLVMNFSIKYPMIPYKIIIVDIAPKKYHNIINIIPILKKVNFNIIKSRNDLNNFLKPLINDIRIIFFISKCTKKNSGGKLRFLFNLNAIEKNYNYLINAKITLGKYNGPSLFLKGEKSDYLVLEDFIIIKKIFPKSKILTIKKSDHWIHIDNPTDFYKEICIFLKKK